MKKPKISKICRIASAILTILFVIKVVLDYITYKTTLNSAPFYLWIVVDAIYFLLPASVLGIISLILQKQSDIRKAQANVVLSLAKALGCDVEDLLA